MGSGAGERGSRGSPKGLRPERKCKETIKVETWNPKPETAAMSLAASLAPITLPDVDGKPVQLGSLWTDKPAVVVFLRHWG